MMIRKLVLVAVLTAASSTVIAQGLMQGTPEEQAACRPDTRRFCHAIKPGSGNESFLSCLQEHRERLSRACRAVLESHGQ
jgi:hypothetical protein